MFVTALTCLIVTLALALTLALIARVGLWGTRVWGYFGEQGYLLTLTLSISISLRLALSLTLSISLILILNLAQALALARTPTHIDLIRDLAEPSAAIHT